MNNLTEQQKLYIVWLLCLTSFSFLMEVQPNLGLFIVLIGIISFAGTWMFAFPKTKLEKAKGTFHLALMTIFITILWFLLLSGSVEAQRLENQKLVQLKKEQQQKKINTCYKIDGTPFVTTSDCNGFVATPTPQATTKPKTTTKKSNPIINCNTTRGIIVRMTQSQCNKFHNTWSESEKRITDDYNNKVNTIPTNNVDYSTTRNYDYDYNYNISPPPTYAPAPTYKPVEFTNPGVNVDFGTPRPTPKDCYNVGGGDATICL